MSNIGSNINITGHVHAVAYHEDGTVYYENEHDFSKGEHNTITELHDAMIAALVCNQSTTTMLYGHAGTGTGQTSASTNLATHCDEARTAITSGTQGAGGDDNDVVVVFTLGAGTCTATLTECGLFPTSNQATGDMLAYDDSVLNSVPKEASDTITVTWTFTYGAS